MWWDSFIGSTLWEEDLFMQMAISSPWHFIEIIGTIWGCFWMRRMWNAFSLHWYLWYDNFLLMRQMWKRRGRKEKCELVSHPTDISTTLLLPCSCLKLTHRPLQWWHQNWLSFFSYPCLLYQIPLCNKCRACAEKVGQFHINHTPSKSAQTNFEQNYL